MPLLIACLLLVSAIDLWQGGYLSAGRGALIAAALLILGSLVVSFHSWSR